MWTNWIEKPLLVLKKDMNEMGYYGNSDLEQLRKLHNLHHWYKPPSCLFLFSSPWSLPKKKKNHNTNKQTNKNMTLWRLVETLEEKLLDFIILFSS